MLKKCEFCGEQYDDQLSVCPKCGQVNSAWKPGNGQETSGGNASAGAPGQGAGSNNQGPLNGKATQADAAAAGIFPMDLVKCVILTIITCGIYGLWWMAKINDEMNRLTREPEPVSGGRVVLYSIITCGIYAMYWNYKMGEKYDRLKGVENGNSSVLFLVLDVFALMIVPLCLIQDFYNKLSQGQQ